MSVTSNINHEHFDDLLLSKPKINFPQCLQAGDFATCQHPKFQTTWPSPFNNITVKRHSVIPRTVSFFWPQNGIAGWPNICHLLCLMSMILLLHNCFISKATLHIDIPSGETEQKNRPSPLCCNLFGRRKGHFLANLQEHPISHDTQNDWGNQQ